MPKRAPAPPTTAEGLRPLSDRKHWWSIVRAQALGEHRPGALLQLYDARNPEDDPRLADAILRYVLEAALRIIRRKMPFDVRDRHDLIEDIFGEVAEIIVDPADQSLRRYFGSTIRNMCLEARRRQWRKESKRDDERLQNVAANPDPERQAALDIDLAELRARIEDPVRRKAIEMLIEGSCYNEVAAALGRHRTTITAWVKASDPMLIEHLRSRTR